MRDLRDLFLEWSLRATDAWALLGTDFVFNPAIGYHDPSCKTNKLFSRDKNYPPVCRTHSTKLLEDLYIFSQVNI